MRGVIDATGGVAALFFSSLALDGWHLLLWSLVLLAVIVTESGERSGGESR